MFLGKMDPKTGKVTQYPAPGRQAGLAGRHARSRDRQGRQSLGRRDVSERRRASSTTRPRQFQIWATPKEWQTRRRPVGHWRSEGTHRRQQSLGQELRRHQIYRLDPVTGQLENLGSSTDPQAASASASTASTRTAEQSLSARLLSRSTSARSRPRPGSSRSIATPIAELAPAARRRR